MLPTRSDRQNARIHIIFTASFIAVTALFLISIMLGIQAIRAEMQKVTGDSTFGKLGYNFLSSLLSSPFGVMGALSWSDLGATEGFTLPIWWTFAKILNALAYVLGIGVLVTSIMGIRVQKYNNISWIGYLMGIIGSALTLTVYFNVMTWWVAGLVLASVSLGMTIKTYKQINVSLESYGDGQPQQMTPQQMQAMMSTQTNPGVGQMQQPSYQNQTAPQYQGQTPQQPPVETTPKTQQMAQMDQTVTAGQPVSFTPEQQPVEPQEQVAASQVQEQQSSEAVQAEMTNESQESIQSGETSDTVANSQASQAASEGIEATAPTNQTSSPQSEEPKE